MVAQAAKLLDSPWPAIEAHIRSRLQAVHGPDAAGRSWLATRPLVTRTDLIPLMRQLLAAKGGPKVEHRKTSGSTGVPFRFVKDLEMAAQMDATMWAVYGWHGVQPGDRQARFWGAPITRRLAAKRKLMDHAQNRRRLSAFDVSPTNSVAFFHYLKRFRPGHAYGYPTLLSTFAHHCRAAGLDGRVLGMKVVICTGEILLPSVREQLGQFFGCRIVNEYGCTESGVIACECEAGTLHLVPVAALGEIVRDDGTPTEPGEAGEVVVTDLYGTTAPLLRYRLHDRAIPARAARCSCARELPSIEVQQGRIDSFIMTPQRGPVYDAILAYTAPAEVLRFRVHQIATDQLRAEIMPGQGFDPQQTPARCRSLWEGALGPGMQVTVETVPEIPLTAAGKLRYFVPLDARAAQEKS